MDGDTYMQSLTQLLLAIWMTALAVLWSLYAFTVTAISLALVLVMVVVASLKIVASRVWSLLTKKEI